MTEAVLAFSLNYVVPTTGNDACHPSLFVCHLLFITRKMRAEGPRQRRAFLNNLFLPRTSLRRHSGAPPPPTLHPRRNTK